MYDIRQDRGRRKIIGMKSDGSPNYVWRDDDDFTDNSLDSGDIYYADDDFSSGSSYRDDLSMSPKKLSAAITDSVSYGNPDLHYDTAMQMVIDDIEDGFDKQPIYKEGCTITIVDGQGESDESITIHAISKVDDDSGEITYYKHIGYYNDATLSYEFEDDDGEPYIEEVEG